MKTMFNSSDRTNSLVRLWLKCVLKKFTCQICVFEQLNPSSFTVMFHLSSPRESVLVKVASFHSFSHYYHLDTYGDRPILRWSVILIHAKTWNMWTTLWHWVKFELSCRFQLIVKRWWRYVWYVFLPSKCQMLSQNWTGLKPNLVLEDEQVVQLDRFYCLCICISPGFRTSDVVYLR